VKPWKRDAARALRANPTPTERLLWQQLRCRRLGVKFRRQAIILGYIVDFYCPAKRLVVEIDGAVHEQRKQYDAHRDAALARHGFRTLRLPAALVGRDLGETVARVRRALA
jgi:very-short-patch-repair endonuclease